MVDEKYVFDMISKKIHQAEQEIEVMHKAYLNMDVDVKMDVKYLKDEGV